MSRSTTSRRSPCGADDDRPAGARRLEHVVPADRHEAAADERREAERVAVLQRADGVEEDDAGRRHRLLPVPAVSSL
jgi:hypothetical protein